MRPSLRLQQVSNRTWRRTPCSRWMTVGKKLCSITPSLHVSFAGMLVCWSCSCSCLHVRSEPVTLPTFYSPDSGFQLSDCSSHHGARSSSLWIPSNPMLNSNNKWLLLCWSLSSGAPVAPPAIAGSVPSAPSGHLSHSTHLSRKFCPKRCSQDLTSSFESGEKTT